MYVRTIELERPSICSSTNFHIFRLTAYSSYPIELKLGRMILDNCPHNHSEPDFSIPSRGRCGVAPFEIYSRFTAYSYYPIELKIDKMILAISLHNR